MATELVARKDARLGWLPDLPDHRDFIFAVPAPQAVPPRVDLSGKLPPPYDQGQLGSCTANAIAGAVEFTAIAQGKPAVTPSRLFIYYNERAMEGTVNSDAGARIRDGIKSVAKQGVCPESEWPYVIKEFTVKPPAQAYRDAKHDLVTSYYRIPLLLTTMLQCLVAGFPFVFGITVYESFMNAPGGVVPMPAPGEGVMGGHAMLCVGYDLASRRFKFRNSWGTGWGDGTGHGSIPFEYLSSNQLGGDYWTIRQEL